MVRLFLAALFMAAPAAAQEVKLLEDPQAESAPAQAAPARDMPQIIVPSDEKPAEAAPAKPAGPEQKPAEAKKAQPKKGKGKAASKTAAKPAAAKTQAAAAAAGVKPAEKTAPESQTAPKPAEAKPVTAAAAKPEAAPAAKPEQKAAAPAAAKPAESAAAGAKPAQLNAEALPELGDIAAAEAKKPEPAAPAKPAEAKPAAPAAKPAPAPKAEVKPAAVPAKPAPKAESKQEEKSAAGTGFAVQKTHVVSGGDTLWDLSSKYYNDPYKWGKIYNANLGVISNPDRIYPKNELVIPDITEEVKPEVRKPLPSMESETVKEAAVVSAEVAQPEAVPAAGPAPEPVTEKLPPARPVKSAAAQLSEALDAYDRNDLSEDMPEHQREWADGVRIVPDSWREDGVITARLRGDEDSMEDSLSTGGDMMEVHMSAGSVKPGDYLNVYMKGAAAYDKDGKRIGTEVQRAGLLEVVGVDGSTVKARVADSVTALTKGLVVKKK